MTPLRTAARLAVWLALLVGAVAALHATGGPLSPPPMSDPAGLGSWAEQRQPAEVALALARLVALGLGWYLLVATVGGLAAGLLGLGALARAFDLVSVGLVRRLVGAVTLSMASTALTVGPATAGTAGPPPPVETMRRLPDAAPTSTTSTTSTTASTTSSTTSTTQPPAAPPAAPPTVPPTAAPAPPPAAPTPSTAPAAGAGSGSGSWTVRPGDHFWSAAERSLAQAWGRPPTDDQVAPYWRSLVAANRDRLRDPGNPDLLFPGQVLVVPAPPPAPPA